MARYKHILVKLSGGAVSGIAEFGIEKSAVDVLADELFRWEVLMSAACRQACHPVLRAERSLRGPPLGPSRQWPPAGGVGVAVARAEQPRPGLRISACPRQKVLAVARVLKRRIGRARPFQCW